MSVTRRRCYDGWVRLRLALVALVPVVSQWVDGSFVTVKPDPGDVDLTTLFDGPGYDAMQGVKKTAAKSLLAGKACQALWGCDSHPIAIYPEGHMYRSLYEAAYRFWEKWWGQDTRTGQAKGYLEVLP
jgi:hypothetical protein